MAFATTLLDDFEDKLCNVCFEEARNPRQLSCSHRYCRDCLVQMIRDRSSDRAFNCPICQQKVHIPKLGVDAFAVDDPDLPDVSEEQPGSHAKTKKPAVLSPMTCQQCTGSSCQRCSMRNSDVLSEAASAAKPNDIFLTEEEEICVDIEGVFSREWHIRGIACTRSGVIVVTGSTGDHRAHITVTNWGGEHVHQTTVQTTASRLVVASFYCVRFKHSKIATVVDPDEVGLFDVDTLRYYKRRLRDDLKTWPAGLGFRSITVDQDNDQLIIGCNKGRSLYVVDESLILRTTIELPSIVKWPFDLCYTNGSIVICDREGQRACAIDMEGTLLYEFTKPESYRIQEPASVCVDKNGFIYILWKESWYKEEKDCVIAQYSRDGRQLLLKRKLHSDAGRMTTADFVADSVGTMEKLLVATWSTGRMHIYGLYDPDEV